MQVYVLNKHGQPLMPCSPAKARRLLEAGKAKVIKRTPFTIQLLYGSTGYKQTIIHGVDAGSKTIGMSASTKSVELFAEEVTPRNDVVKNLSTRREFRRPGGTGRLDIANLASTTGFTASTRVGWPRPWRSKSRSISPRSRKYAPSCLSVKWLLRPRNSIFSS